MRSVQRMRMLILLLSVLLVVGFLPTTAQAEVTPANRFILVAESKDKLIIPPTYVYHAGGATTMLEALDNSGFELTGLDQLWITAIEGVSGNFTRSDEDGDYEFTKLASEVTHYCFSERSADKSTPSKDQQSLMTAMADYLEKDADVQKAALAQYREARSSFLGIQDADARTLAYELNKAISDYEKIINGKTYAVAFNDGSALYSQEAYSGVSITAVNAYGRQWSDDADGDGKGDGKLELPMGQYTFQISQKGLSVSGNITVSDHTEFTVKLPKDRWLKLDKNSFRLSGSYGEASNEFHHFTDDEFSRGDWNEDDRSLTVPVRDTFSGKVYTYAEYDKAILQTAPSLTAVYTAKNAAGSSMNKSIAFSSLTQGAEAVLAKGVEGNTVIYRLSRTENGYIYSQDYTVHFVRIPTLASITVRDDAGTDQAPTSVFDGTKTEAEDNTYMVLDTVKYLSISAVPYVSEYEVRINGVKAEECTGVDISGETEIEISVSSGKYTNVYHLKVLPGEGRTKIFSSEKEVILQVFNSNGVEIPYTYFKESETSNRYRFTLVPNVEYSYVATFDEHYHISDVFKMSDDNSIISIDFQDAAEDRDWLKEFALGISAGQSNKGSIPLNPEFSADCHVYQAVYPDTESAVYLWSNFDGEIDTQVFYNQLFSTELNHGKEQSCDVDPGVRKGIQLKNFLMFANPTENTLTLRLSKEIDNVTHYQDYVVEFKRSLTLQNLTAKCDGFETVLQRADKKTGFDPKVKQYTVNVSMAAQLLALDFACYEDNLCYGQEEMGYIVKVDGRNVTDAGVAYIELDGTINTQKVVIQVENPLAPDGTATYEINIQKSPPVATTFLLEPAGALLNIREVLSGERLWPDATGTFQLCEDYSYDYALTQFGYVSKSGTLKVTRNENKELVIQDYRDKKLLQEYKVEQADVGGAATILWGIEKAAPNSAIDESIESEWPNFRGKDDNNAITAARIPFLAEKGTLYWATKIGEGYDADAVGSPILVDDVIITYAGSSIFRVDPMTGEILKTGEMSHKSSFSITPPTYAEGMVFVALANGSVQAFNAKTLESLWIYKDPLGGQPNCPLTVKNGYLYTGFWNSETGDARFVCMSITDEQPNEPKEEKCVSWFHQAKGGFYWAGAYVDDNYVMVGTDDGENGYRTNTSRMLLMDAKTGRLLDSWDNLNADIRCTVVYDKVTQAYYFTSKGGTFYSFQVSNGAITNQRSLKLENNSGGIPMSTCSPCVYNGRAYVGVSGSSQFGPYSGHNITVIDLVNWKIAYSVPTQGYPQTSGLLTTAYQSETGYVYVYFFDNYTPGKLRVLRDRVGQTEPNHITKESIEDMGVEYTYDTAYALFTPTGDQAQYAICSPIVDKYGTVYFKNDSGYLMAFGSAITSIEVTQMPAKTNYIAGEKFNPAGMVVTATYANGIERDITSYVSAAHVTAAEEGAGQKVIYVPCHQKELTEQDTNFTISFTHVRYHNQEDGTGMESAVPTTTPVATIRLDIGGGLLGDVDGNGIIEAPDAQMILDQEAQLLKKELILAVSDVSGDGVIDSNDAVLIQQYLAKKFEKFPAEEAAVEPEEESQPTE